MNGVFQPEYTVLAEIYDEVMENVNYEIWADFIDEIIQRHHPNPQSVLELACGTGSLSLALDRYGCYSPIVGTDKSAQMIQKAYLKDPDQHPAVSFRTMDFLNIDLDRSFDIVVSIFDSVNYLKSEDEIKQLMRQTKKVMKNPYSLFIFDFTTPVNSEQAVKHLDENSGLTNDHYRFFRRSIYDEAEQIHRNNFEIEELDEEGHLLHRYSEQHQQRIYSLTQMKRIVQETDFAIKAAYGEFDLNEATPESLRVTMVLTCPNTPL